MAASQLQDSIMHFPCCHHLKPLLGGFVEGGGTQIPKHTNIWPSPHYGHSIVFLLHRNSHGEKPPHTWKSPEFPFLILKTFFVITLAASLPRKGILPKTCTCFLSLGTAVPHFCTTGWRGRPFQSPLLSMAFLDPENLCDV